MPYCCYLLTPLDKKNCGKVTYVGFTNNPMRRIRQHNGEIKNGAKRTTRHRPWEFVLVVVGFPTKFSALSFEWAWQHSQASRMFSQTVKQQLKTTSYRKIGGKQSVKRKLIELTYMLTACPSFSKFSLIVNFQHQSNANIFKDLLRQQFICNSLPHYISGICSYINMFTFQL
mmetsp:Transcript_20169/g.24451  ORF Transcript_20169/g.24451 Transcript_20169/m.24451 type:complete len:172 (+) Transcript_20169:116-631(+)